MNQNRIGFVFNNNQINQISPERGLDIALDAIFDDSIASTTRRSSTSSSSSHTTLSSITAPVERRRGIMSRLRTLFSR